MEFAVELVEKWKALNPGCNKVPGHECSSETLLTCARFMW